MTAHRTKVTSFAAAGMRMFRPTCLDCQQIIGKTTSDYIDAKAAATGHGELVAR